MYQKYYVLERLQTRYDYIPNYSIGKVVNSPTDALFIPEPIYLNFWYINPMTNLNLLNIKPNYRQELALVEWRTPNTCREHGTLALLTRNGPTPIDIVWHQQSMNAFKLPKTLYQKMHMLPNNIFNETLIHFSKQIVMPKLIDLTDYIHQMYCVFVVIIGGQCEDFYIRVIHDDQPVLKHRFIPQDMGEYQLHFFALDLRHIYSMAEKIFYNPIGFVEYYMKQEEDRERRKTEIRAKRLFKTFKHLLLTGLLRDMCYLITLFVHGDRRIKKNINVIDLTSNNIN